MIVNIFYDLSFSNEKTHNHHNMKWMVKRSNQNQEKKGVIRGT
jgi:hypothetical protein